MTSLTNETFMISLSRSQNMYITSHDLPYQ